MAYPPQVRPGVGILRRPIAAAQLTDEDGAEEVGDGDVDDGGGHVEEPVGGHGKEPQEEQEEKQAILVLLHLRGAGRETERQRGRF